MSYIGDFRLGDTFDSKFCTVSTTGAPTTLAGTPVVSAYVGNSTTELTAGITLSVDFDSRTGMHNVRVVASSGNGYATASNYQLVITTGTVGGTSVVGYVIGEFSIEARSALMPTTAARTLDVSATGEGGVDWANVGSPTTTVALTNTSIVPTQKVDVDTIKTNPVVNGGTLTFPTNKTLASTDNITGGTITTVSGNVAGSVGSVTGNVGGNVVGSVASVTGNVGGSVASVTGNVGGNVVGSVASVTARVTANTDQLAGQTVTAAAGVTFPTSVASPTNITGATGIDVTKVNGSVINNLISGRLDANAQVIGSAAISSTSFAANAIDSAALATSAANEIRDAVFARGFSATYGSFTFEQMVEIIVASQAGKLSGAATTSIAIRTLDDSATVIAATVDASGNRTAVTVTP